MSLRTKLLCGYVVFIAALVALGGWSAWRLRDMGGVSRRIIAENYDSVVAAQDMKESLERQDSAALFILLGQRQRTLAVREEGQRRYASHSRWPALWLPAPDYRVALIVMLCWTASCRAASIS